MVKKLYFGYRLGRSKNTKFKLLKVISLFIFIVTYISLSLYGYYEQGRETISETVYSTLSDSSLQQISTFNSIIKERYSILETMNISMSPSLVTDEENAIKLTNELVRIENFHHIGIVNINTNIAYVNTGDTFDASDREYYLAACRGEKYMQYIPNNRVDGESLIVLGVPVFINEKVVAVTFGSFATQSLSDQIVSEAFGKKSYSFVCDKEGKTVMGSKNSDTLLYSDNVLDLLNNSKLSDGITAEKIAEDLLNSRGNTIVYTYKGEKRYASYLSLGVNEWTIFNVVSAETVDSLMHSFSIYMYILVGKLLLLLGGLFLTFIFFEKKSRDEATIDNEKFELFDEYVEVVLFEGDFTRDRITFNRNFGKVFGYEPKTDCLSKIDIYVEFIYKDDRQDFIKFIKDIRSGTTSAHTDIRVVKKNGKMNWYRIDARIITNKNGKPIRLVGKISDVDEFKREVNVLKGLSERDSLTELYNRFTFNECVESMIAGCGKKAEHALMVLDIDNFKWVNDTYGHAAGDNVLICISQTLKRTLANKAVIGRYGGDEFIIFVKEIAGIASAKALSELICEEISKCTDFKIQGLTVTCSIGIALYPIHADKYDILFQAADAALYNAKRNGKNQTEVFNVAEEAPFQIKGE